MIVILKIFIPEKWSKMNIELTRINRSGNDRPARGALSHGSVGSEEGTRESRRSGHYGVNPPGPTNAAGAGSINSSNPSHQRPATPERFKRMANNNNVPGPIHNGGPPIMVGSSNMNGPHGPMNPNGAYGRGAAPVNNAPPSRQYRRFNNRNSRGRRDDGGPYEHEMYNGELLILSLKWNAAEITHRYLC